MCNTPLITLNMCNKKTNSVTTCEYKLMFFYLYGVLEIDSSLPKMISAPGKTILMLFLYFFNKLRIYNI